MIYEKKSYRTTKLNEAFALICADNKPSNKTKNGKNLVLSKSSRSVENTGFEPVASCLPGKRSSQMS